MSHPIATKHPHITLRFAVEADTGLILSFIRQLAAYEKLSHEVRTDEASLRHSLFRGPKIAEVIIAEYDGSAVGFALFFHNFSTFLGKPGIYLEDLFVEPGYRGKGVGKHLLAFLAKLARERGCGRLEWWALDWNAPAIDFYRHLGAEAMAEWTVYRLSGAALDALAADFD